MSKPATLHLNLHREFFAAVAEGRKKREFRRYTPYWRRRIENRQYDLIQFRNGYATKAPVMVVEYRGYRVRGQGRNREFSIRLGRILQIKRWRP